MKNIVQHPAEPQTGKQYWRSLNELENKPEFKSWLEKEFPAGAAEMEMDAVSRRNFLQLMGASVALAGMGVGCRRPEAHILAYTKSVEYVIPGRALHYATALPRQRGGISILAKSYEGRPTHLEGNPTFPGSNGGLDAYGQASILDLYDPDRSRVLTKDGVTIAPQAFFDFVDGLRASEAATKGAGLAFLTTSSVSPTVDRLKGEILKQFPSATWAVYDAISHENELAATQLAFGQKLQFFPAYDKASVIFAIETDFLGGEEGGVRSIKEFTSKRKIGSPQDEMNRLYVVESHFTTTGGFADHRLRLAARYQGAFVLALAQELIAQGLGGKLVDVIKGAPAAPTIPTLNPVWLKEAAADLISQKDKALVVAGFNQSVFTQALVLAINDALGAFGKTAFLKVPNRITGAPLTELVDKVKTGTVNTLFVLGGNPAYNAPAELDFAAALKNVPTVVRLADVIDETVKAGAKTTSYVVPSAHYLEAWGDAYSEEGYYLTAQPQILPLWGGFSEIEILGKIAGLARPAGPELVQDTFKALFKTTDFDADWRSTVHGGYYEKSGRADVTASFNAAAVAGYVAANVPATGADDVLEVVFHPDPSVIDGRHANNGWLQELPDPITKLTWDNAALISPALAKKYGIFDRDVLKIEVNGKSLEIAAIITPGQTENSIAIALGYGRTGGRVAEGAGVNVYPLRTSATLNYAVGATITKTGKTYLLSHTQEHYSMEGRALVREARLDEYRANPKFPRMLGIDNHQPGFTGEEGTVAQDYRTSSAYVSPKLNGEHQWGMVIDLNTCVGCNACVIACQSENNIPIVGKDQVWRGREMHWIRIDRYFASDRPYEEDRDLKIAKDVEYLEKNKATTDYLPEDPQMLTEPILCMHCENAPCETVCPVNATIHSEEGLNGMAYNRCIGTRYCANNCPYKVRRFNFFDYNQRPVQSIKDGFWAGKSRLYYGPLEKKGSPETIQMQKNPNVTVRMRGVMEKCSFCVQRIEEAKIDARVKAGPSPDIKVKADAFKTACQQSCPSSAITFGNIADPDSAVSKLKGTDREYGLLTYLDTRPRVTYLARVRNPNMKMPGADKMGLNLMGGHHHGGHAAHAESAEGHETATPAVEGGHH